MLEMSKGEMKGKYMLIWTYADSGGMNMSWHKTEADALESILNILPSEWIILGVGDDGTQREPNDHPIVIRSHKNVKKIE